MTFGLPVEGLDSVHDIKFIRKAEDHIYITGEVRKGRMELPFRMNLKVSVDAEFVASMAKLAMKPG